MDFSPPLWTYQLCAGVTRIGDPQAFGLSPVFLIIIILGSLIGAKALIVSCVYLGYRCLAALLSKIADTSWRGIPLSGALSLSYFFGNYFLWHFQAGHLTFAMIPLVVSLFCWAVISPLKGSESERLSKAEFFVCAGLVWSFLTAGFYHALIFVVFPLTLASLLIVLVAVKSRWIRAQRFTGWLGACLLGGLVASYKWVPALLYQIEFPRELIQSPVEDFSVWKFLIFQLVPTWNELFAGISNGWGPWTIKEYSAFSALPYLWIAACALGGWGGRKVAACFVAALGVWFFFLLGDSVPWSAHQLLNRYVSNHSIRAIGRYQGGFQLVLALWIVCICARSPLARDKLSRFGIPIALFVALFNLLSFGSSVSVAKLSEIWSYPSNPETEMRVLRLVKKREIYPVADSWTYAGVLAGEIVPNCYQPLVRPLRLYGEFEISSGIQVGSQGEISLIDDPHAGPECKESVFVTQNQLHWMPGKCPSGTCVNLNGINPRQDPSLTPNSAGLFCF